MTLFPFKFVGSLGSGGRPFVSSVDDPNVNRLLQNQAYTREERTLLSVFHL